MSKTLPILNTMRESDILPDEFFEQEIHALACDLLGRDLVRINGDQLLAGRIVEVEVYAGSGDAASHASSGKPTKRTWPMFGPPGVVYIYKIYGMYHCLNIVARPENEAGAILIRALEPLHGIDLMAASRGIGKARSSKPDPASIRNLLNGPGKLCQAMGIDMGFNGIRLNQHELFLLEGKPIGPDDAHRIAKTERVGLNPKTVGNAVTWPWRYIVHDSPYLSRKLPRTE